MGLGIGEGKGRRERVGGSGERASDGLGGMNAACSPPAKVRLTMRYPSPGDEHAHVGPTGTPEAVATAREAAAEGRLAAAEAKHVALLATHAAQASQRRVAAVVDRRGHADQLADLQLKLEAAEALVKSNNIHFPSLLRTARSDAHQARLKAAALAEQAGEAAELRIQSAALQARLVVLEGRVAHHQVDRGDVADARAELAAAHARTREAVKGREAAEARAAKAEGSVAAAVAAAADASACAVAASDVAVATKVLGKLGKLQQKLDSLRDSPGGQLQSMFKRDWAHLRGQSEKNARGAEVGVLVNVLQCRPWRLDDIVAALMTAEIDGEVLLLMLFNTEPMWGLRLGWLRSVVDDLERGRWGAGFAVKMRTQGPASERLLDSFRYGFSFSYDAAIDRHKPEVWLRNPHDLTDVAYLPCPITNRHSSKRPRLRYRLKWMRRRVRWRRAGCWM